MIALIEVMKFFYEIKYEGDSAVVAAHKGSKDAEPIEAGAVIWYWK